MNEEQIDNILEQFEEIQREAARIAPYLAELKYGERPPPFDTDEIFLQDNQYLCAAWSVRDRCSDYRDEYEVYIPTSYLFNDNIIAELEEQIRVAKEKKDAEALEKQKEKKQRERDYDYKKFLELQEKFGGEV